MCTLSAAFQLVRYNLSVHGANRVHALEVRFLRILSDAVRFAESQPDEELGSDKVMQTVMGGLARRHNELVTLVVPHLKLSLCIV